MITSRSQLQGVAFVGGGSGGHLFPGIAVAQRACERFPGCHIQFFCAPRRADRRVFSHANFPTQIVEIPLPSRADAWIRYSLAVVKATRALRRSFRARPLDVVVGLGGYASVPGILAARAESIPVILMEQNRVAGRVNRLLSPMVSAVSCSFAETDFRRTPRCEVTGNPVRREVLAQLERGRYQAQNGRLVATGNGDGKTVLVVGGSQGAQGLNQALLAAMPGLEEWRERVRWIHVAGPGYAAVQKRYDELGWRAEVRGFADDLPELMNAADFVISRAGGTTLSELAVLGLPALLVPYPYARDQHQLVNARAYAEAGAGIVMREKELRVEPLRAVFRDVLFESARLEEMVNCARRLGRPQAADSVIDLALELSEPCPSASVSLS